MNALRRIKRQRKHIKSMKDIKKKPQTKMAMNYECRDCGKSLRMWLQTGLEEHGENHKPVPFAIGCKYCNGIAYHVNWNEDIQLDEPIDITEDMDYFANVSDCDCGKPVYSKNRKAITCNGRPAFFNSMYEDIRNCAMSWGWCVALHGSLMNDMDIMAMPWTEEAIKFEELVDKISKLFDRNSLAENYTITYDEKPHNRVVATIPIWEDFYLDISTIDTRKPMERILERIEKARQKYQRLVKEQGEKEDESMNIHFRGVMKIVKEEGGIE